MRILCLLLISYLLSGTIGYSIQYSSNSISGNKSYNLIGNELFSPKEFKLLNTKVSYTFALYEDYDRYEFPELESGFVKKNGHELNHIKSKSIDVLIKSFSYSIPNGAAEKRAVSYVTKPQENGASQPKLFSSFGKRETIFLPLGLFVFIKKKF